MEKTFYRCGECGNLVGLINKGIGELVCCGKPMIMLTANTTDAAVEKHVPAFKFEGAKLSVQVGDTLHPMTTEHYIQWIMVTQDNLTQRVELTPDDEPKAVFTINPDGGPITVFEYCNLHGLWKK